ncbi:hypothetical protein KY314_04050 [Candidatus Woesearchaeota archaeon]|nr:hypothetical protein [Candidatus Woesearchaeota archaeon]
MNKKLWEILVPAEWNWGCKIPIDHHRNWDDKVREIAEGLTILKTARGHWVSKRNNRFIEKMIPVRIMCTEKEINEIADFTAGHYGQQAVMFYKISDEVIIKEYK